MEFSLVFKRKGRKNGDKLEMKKEERVGWRVFLKYIL
jgi:hypothetical protein